MSDKRVVVCKRDARFPTNGPPYCSCILMGSVCAKQRGLEPQPTPSRTRTLLASSRDEARLREDVARYEPDLRKLAEDDSSRKQKP